MPARSAARYVLGVDGGTEGVRCGVYEVHDGREVAYCSAHYPTSYPQPGWAEQDPEQWWSALGAAVKGAVARLGAAVAPQDIGALCVDTTCCTVVALDAAANPLRPALLWMDVRAAAQAARVAACCDEALLVNGGGSGPVSAEWFVPKALWLKENQPKLYAAAHSLCEYQDFINLRLTGSLVASSNNAAVRWHWRHGTTPPASLLRALDLEDLLPKWPRSALKPGQPIGRGLSAAAAKHLGLPEGLVVAQGGADAFIGMLGLNVLRPGQLALLTGSSHLHLGVTASQVHGAGVWGTYAGALPLGGRFVVEGGQTSTGSVASWFRRLVSSDTDALVSYNALDAEAAAVPPGCEGLVCQEHFQGNRTPHTDAASRGALVGLTLRHGRGHLFRAILEGVAFGTRLVLDQMRSAGFQPESITVAGGAARSPLWLQIHADVTGLPLCVTRQGEAPALGCAALAAVACGAFENVEQAAEAMVHAERVVNPNMERHAAYEPFYQAYRELYGATKGVVRAAAEAARV